MKLLALDTSTEACSVAIGDGEQRWSRFEICPRQHNQQLASMLREVREEAGLDFADLDGLVCGIGPGSFTGIRVAVGMAQGMAAALDIPVMPVTTTASLALQALRRYPDARQAAIAMDARMGDIYWAIYGVGGAGMPIVVEVERLADPATLALPSGAPWVAAGSLWRSEGSPLAALLEADTPVADDLHPDAANMLELARHDWQPIAPAALSPLYLRSEVARKSAAANR